MSSFTIGYLGPRGSNGHRAAELFGAREGFIKEDPIAFLSFDSHREIFRAVRNGELNAGAVPIENSSTDGLIGDVIGRWKVEKSQCCVVGEQWLKVRHCIAAHPDTTAIEHVISHPEALAQCAGSLGGLGISDQRPAKSTAAAACMVSAMLPGMGNAAICSRFAADIYGLKVVHADIQDSNFNATRFHLIMRSKGCDKPPNKLAILFGLKHEVGALADVLDLVRAFKGNITSLHSVAMGAPEDFVFYMEIEDILGNWQSFEETLRLNVTDYRKLGWFEAHKEVEE